MVSWHSVSASTADPLLQLTTAVPNDSFSLNLGGALSQECSGGMEVALQLLQLPSRRRKRLLLYLLEQDTATAARVAG